MPLPPNGDQLERFRRVVVAHNGYLIACLARLRDRGFTSRHVFYLRVEAAQRAADILAAHLNAYSIGEGATGHGVDEVLRETGPEPRAQVWPDAAGVTRR